MSESAVYRPDEAKDHRAAEVLRFWFGERAEYGKSRKRWFKKDAAFDAEIRARFLALHAELSGGGLEHWQTTAPECLARIVVLDQFSRNLFRDDPRAFASDALALATAREAIARGIDRPLLPVERLFVYLPFEHSESLEDQRLCCELMAQLTDFPETHDLPEWALKHLRVIERFGRFPHRNAALGRTSTPEELEYLAQPGAGF
jgi:uncharacterized protein (DUF924 family)